MPSCWRFGKALGVWSVFKIFTELFKIWGNLPLGSRPASIDFLTVLRTLLLKLFEALRSRIFSSNV